MGVNPSIIRLYEKGLKKAQLSLEMAQNIKAAAIEKYTSEDFK